MAKGKSVRKRFWFLLDLIFGVGLFMVATIAYTPLTAHLLRPLTVKEGVKNADIIIVLGGGVDGGNHLTLISSHRMVRGIQLYFEGRAKKILFSGGIPKEGRVSEAAVMAQEARRLRIPPEDIILEKRSKRTSEQAVELKKIADSLQLKSILLVTSSSHMKRAVMLFEQAGLKVYPAPADPYEKYTDDPLGRLCLFPKIIHEYGGILYYKMKGWI